ncbi:MAG: phosphate ABC transporter substrate-binding protein [Treponema sp.]|jgi:phosphate transport system substrate-binding protein|nr:phosphate ABC transporter substrate-binding protein [Treponema sp.]
MKMTKIAVGIAALVLSTSMVFAGGSKDKGKSAEVATVTASGSSALFPLAKDAADKYKSVNPNVSVTISAGGSGTGLAQVSDGSVDIGNSDVFAESKLDAAKAAELVDHKVCVITMAPVINNELAKDVKNLTRQQLIDIFTAKITNWNAVGGPDEPILLVTRPTTSGTRALFKEFALNGAEEASNKSLETDNSGTLLQTVAQNKGAVGYLALSYLVNNNSVSTVSIDGVAPTAGNTYNGTYPVWGYEHMYTKGEGSKAAQDFINYMMGSDYGKNIEAQGYCVTAKMKVSR